MIRALYTAASGMNAQQANIDNVAQQPRQREHRRLQEEPDGVRGPGLPADHGAGAPTSTATRSADRARDRPRHAAGRHGARLPHGNLRRPRRRSTSRSKGAASSRFDADGETAYTRAGSLHLTREGALVTADGYRRRAGRSPFPRTRCRCRSRRTASSRSRLPGSPRRSRSAPSSSPRSRTRRACARSAAISSPRPRRRASRRRRAGHGRHRHARAGVPRRLERQRRRGDGQHDPRPACLRGELEGREGRPMKCSRRSTTLSGKRAVVLGCSSGWSLAGAARAATRCGVARRVAEAIARAVHRRMGPARPGVEQVWGRPPRAASEPIEVTPVPDARAGPAGAIRCLFDARPGRRRRRRRWRRCT